MTTANFRAFVFGAVAVAAAALGAGCNLEPSAVNNPTYEADVRPIFMSRCIRCHGNPPLGDTGTSPPSPVAPINLRFDVFADTNCEADAGGTCVHGAASEALANKFNFYLVTYAGTALEMPPSPAPKLTSYQRDTILKWESEGQNGGTLLEQ